MTTLPIFDDTGVQILDVNQIRDNVRERVAGSSELGPSVRTGPDTAMGQIIDAPAEELSDVYELAQDIYDQFSLENASGIQLDNLGELRGVIREPAAKSTGVITATGTPTTPIPSGSIVRVPLAGRFVTTAPAVIGGGGTVDINVESEDTGPIEGNAGTITEIVTAIPGWASVTNAADVDLGQDVESDARYKLRIRRSGAIGGTATDRAIQARLEQLTIVDYALAYSNRSDVVDPVTGQPRNSLQVFIWPVLAIAEDKQTVVETVWGPAGLGAGIQAFGTEQFTVTDSQGTAQPVAFSYATEVEIYFLAEVLQANVEFPANGDDLIKEVIAFYFDEKQGIGTDVLPFDISCEITKVVPGIEHFRLALLAGSPPGSTNTSPISIGVFQIATVDPLNIVVTTP